MLRIWLLTLVVLSATAAERAFDFSLLPENKQPANFQSLLTGQGKPGDWKIIYDEVPPLLPPLSAQAPVVTRRSVLAQTSADPTDERFPILAYEPESYGDFTFSTRFKTVEGSQEQMAGIVFRLKDATNYYVLRASSLGNTLRFYKVVNGERGTILGPTLPIPRGQWHELSVECKGNQIRCFLNGKQEIPTITDNSFTIGKVGFWTKSDSVSYFTDAKITYVPREPAGQALVRSMLEKYKRLIDIQIFAKGTEPGTTRLIGTRAESELGKAGGKVELDVIENGNTYYGKEKKSVSVTMPLRDQNGEIIAATRVIMTTFKGQTEKNAVERAAPLVREMQGRVSTRADLVE